MMSFTSTRLADYAVYNNAVWCDTICKAHGNPGVFEPGIWFNAKPVPRFYPNTVTLTRSQEDHSSAIKKLMTAETLQHFAVKDSFASLNLDELGFTTLFEAEWIWLSPDVAMPLNNIQDIQWQIVKTPDELMHWEIAWNNGALGDNARIFLPSLLDNPDVIFVAGYKQQHIVAGAIGNRTGEVVGLSNLFAPSEMAIHYWAECIHLIRATYSGLALVGYERGEDLAIALQLGFEKTGTLRVWVR